MRVEISVNDVIVGSGNMDRGGSVCCVTWMRVTREAAQRPWWLPRPFQLLFAHAIDMLARLRPGNLPHRGAPVVSTMDHIRGVPTMFLVGDRRILPSSWGVRYGDRVRIRIIRE